jgi:hypothetical protein
MKKSSVKLVFYMVSCTVLGCAGLLFNKIPLVRYPCHFAMIIVAAFMYFDKKYRKKYIPSLPDWYIGSLVVLSLLLTVYSFFI